MITLRSYLLQHPEAGVGEIGLDRARRPCCGNMPMQMEFFKRQLMLAVELCRPVSIHSVRTHGLVLEALESTGFSRAGLPFVLHQYCGGRDLTSMFLTAATSKDDGPFFSVSAKLFHGAAAASAREVLGGIPLDRLLIETDSPCQPVAPGPGCTTSPPLLSPTVNDCSQLVNTAHLVADCLNIDNVAELTFENAKRAFRVKLLQ
jgi:TatD DNase family protein